MNSKQKLLSWFQLSKRDLPFRKHKAAYEIWISEIMLQQTRVAAMLPLYTKFLDRFPNIEKLALATEEEVLSAWQGLGYYSRARNLRKAAIYLMANYNGKFPKNLDEVLKIPGIGPYTARAVLSIAYDLKFAVLDGNVKRVLSRYYLYKDPILGNKADKELQVLADDFLNLESPGDHNQALMELGATICLPEKPKCLLCPLIGVCLAQIENKTDQIPDRSKQKKQIELQAEILWIAKGDSVLLLREKKQRFLKGMFTLPIVFKNVERESEFVSSDSLHHLRDLFTYHDISKKIRHTITHHKFDFYVKVTHLTDDNETLSAKEFSEETETKWVSISNLTSEFPSSIATKVKKLVLAH